MRENDEVAYLFKGCFVSLNDIKHITFLNKNPLLDSYTLLYIDGALVL